jgi:hypothetical protein
MTKFMELKGGLGNQLFQYFAGQMIAKEASDDLVLTLPNSSQHKIHHASSILDLELPQIVETDFVASTGRSSLLRKGRNLLTRKSDFLRGLLNRYSSTYVSGPVGFDSNFLNFSDSTFFEGYFQTYRYVEEFREEINFSLRPVRRSHCYEKTLIEIREKKPTAVHIRRADYLPLKETIGILGCDYYKRALTIVNDRNPNSPIWLFTDDLEGAQQALQNLDVVFDRIITADTELSAAETLILLSEAPCKIIANSTFSWWAAYLGSGGGLIIAPSPWYRTNSIEAELIPANWMLINSDWEN